MPSILSFRLALKTHDIRQGVYSFKKGYKIMQQENSEETKDLWTDCTMD